MKYAILGKTGLEISRIGFGGIPIQQVDQESTNKIVDRAIEQGINFIDTARGYTVSEGLLGNALQGKRDKVYIASKSMARDKEALKKDVLLSMELLKIDYIDLYQIHNIGSLPEFEKLIAQGGGLEALVELKEQGLVRHIGITSHSLPVIEKALDYEVFETVQYPYNAVETQATEIFKKAKERNVGVIVMKPLAGGALTDGRRALKFILENNDVTAAIPGMDSLEQVDINAEAADGIPLTEQERKELVETAASLGQTFCRRCGYCQPCHKGINIPLVFLLEGYYTRYDLVDWALTRYDTLPVKPDECEKCGLCEPRCPYKLPIREMLEKAKNIFK